MTLQPGDARSKRLSRAPVARVTRPSMSVPAEHADQFPFNMFEGEFVENYTPGELDADPHVQTGGEIIAEGLNQPEEL